MLEELCPSEIVRNYYSYIRDYRNRELRFIDPRTNVDVLASDCIDNSKISEGIQRIKRNFLPHGIHTMYRLMDDRIYRSEQVNVSFATYIQMEELLDRIRAFRGLSYKGSKPVIIEDSGREVLRITRGEKGYRRMIFTPSGESKGIGINKTNNFEANPLALDILDAIYNDGLLEFILEDNEGVFSVGLRQIMSQSQEPIMEQRMLTAFALMEETKKVDRYVTSSAVNKTSARQVNEFVRNLLRTGIAEKY